MWWWSNLIFYRRNERGSMKCEVGSVKCGARSASRRDETFIDEKAKRISSFFDPARRQGLSSTIGSFVVSPRWIKKGSCRLGASIKVASLRDALLTGTQHHPNLPLWVKTRRDKGFSFRLDTKVVPKYPVKA